MKCAEISWLLADYQAGLLNNLQHRTVAQHLENCPECRSNALIAGELDHVLNPLVPKLQLKSATTRPRHWLRLAAAILAAMVLINIALSQAGYATPLTHLWQVIRDTVVDLGTQKAIHDGFGNWTGLSQQHNGVTFTIEGVVTDESRTVVLFSIKADADWHKQNRADGAFFTLEDLALTTPKGNNPSHSIQYARIMDSGKDFTIGSITIHGNNMGTLTLTTRISAWINGIPADTRRLLPGLWEFTLDTGGNFSEPLVFTPEDGVFTVFGSRFEVINFKLYPTQAIVEISSELAAGWKIRELEQVILTDNAGNSYPRLWSHITGDIIRLGFVSPFTQKPDYLVLSGQGAYVIREGEDLITVEIGAGYQIVESLDTRFNIKADWDSLGNLVIVSSDQGRSKLHLLEIIDDTGHSPSSHTMTIDQSGNYVSTIAGLNPQAEAVTFRIYRHGFSRGPAWEVQGRP